GGGGGGGSDRASVLVWSPDRDDQANASVTDVTVGGGLAPRAGERWTVVAEIGGSARDSVNVRLSLDGRIAGAAIAAPGSAALLTLPPRNASLVTGEVQIDADALRADDRRYFVATIEPPPTVTLTRATPFVSQALTVLADAGRVRRTTSSNADVLIAPAAAGTEGAGPGSAVVVLAPATPLELPAVNRRLETLGINWRYAGAGAEAEAEAGVALTGGDAGADALGRALENVRVSTFYQLQPIGRGGVDSVLLRLENGAPYAVRGTRARGGRFVLLASPLTTEATNLPATAAMIPLLDRLTGVWSAADAPRSEAQPGERVAMPRAAETAIDPNGTRYRVTGGETFSDAVEPGIYRVVGSGNVIGAFVVNPAPAESELRYAEDRRVDRALAGVNVRHADSPREWERRIFDARVGREFWRVVLWTLLVLLLIEAAAAATGTRTPRPAPGSVPAPVTAQD
ncbi:MAG: hypothetical protein ACT443_12335, partial [Gemmatimonadota bacterium]